MYAYIFLHVYRTATQHSRLDYPAVHNKIFPTQDFAINKPIMCRLILWHFDCENCQKRVSSDYEHDKCDIALGLVDGICAYMQNPARNPRHTLTRTTMIERERCSTCKKEKGKEKKKEEKEEDEGKGKKE